MTIDEMREHEWVVSWSGGKDSTATILLMREHNIPIKEIVYVRMMWDDTLPATLPIMTNFVDEQIKRLTEWGYKVRMVYPTQSALSLTQKVYKRSKHLDRNGKAYGISCFMRGHCKMTHFKQWACQKAINKDDYQMIGYGADEVDRLHRLGGKKQSIMVALGITEKDAFEICKAHNMLSPLYELGAYRDGCWFCPNVDKKMRARLRNEHPNLVAKITELIEYSKNNYDISSTVTRNNWLDDYMKGIR